MGQSPAVKNKIIDKKRVKGFTIRKTKKCCSKSKHIRTSEKDSKEKMQVYSSLQALDARNDSSYPFKRSQSRLEDKPVKIYEENAFEDLIKKRNSLTFV